MVSQRQNQTATAMKVSELITALQHSIDECGDATVLLYNPYEDKTEEVDVVVYGEGDNTVTLQPQ